MTFVDVAPHGSALNEDVAYPFDGVVAPLESRPLSAPRHDVRPARNTQPRRYDLDTLEILAKAEKLGGEVRKDAMMKTFISARQLGCDITPGGGKVGGFNVRYGTLKYAIMDMNTRGEVFLHIKHHPSKDLPPKMKSDANEFVSNLDGLTIKNAPINHYGQAEEPIEEIPEETLQTFLEYAVETIRREYYSPHVGNDA